MSSGSPFRLEKDLVEVLCTSALQELTTTPGDSGELMRQVAVGASETRIPDVVLLFRQPTARTRPIALTYFDAALVSALLDCTGTAADLCSRFFADPTEIERRLERLCARGVLTKSDNDSYRVNEAALPGSLRIVAIEAKLSRWKDALSQAEGYRTFANETFIAVPESVATRLDIVQTCAVAGVGIIAVAETGVRVLLDAAHHQPRTAEWVRFVSTTVGVGQSRSAELRASRQAR